ncbi:MAG: type IV pilus assembly protein PilM [Candidatus Lloydbacteria bacterium]|nr:type IV pilus assembly protein PilM [Candidatus Lloydbacteria bacterium]
MAVNFITTLLEKIRSLQGGEKGESAVGIDIGSAFIKVVQIKSKGGKAILETYGEIALGPYAGGEIGQATNLPAEKIAEALTDLFREAGVTTKNAALSISLKSSLLSLIEVPVADGSSQLNEIIPIEARKYIPVPINEVTLDWWVIPKRETYAEQDGVSSDDESKGAESSHKTIPHGSTEVMMVAIHNEAIEKYRRVASIMQFEKVFFELEVFSAMRSTLGRSMQTVLLVDIGATTTKLAIAEFGVTRFTHTISRGSQDITVALSKAQSVSFSAAEDTKRTSGVSVGAENGGGIKGTEGSSASGQKEITVSHIANLTLENIFGETNTMLMQYQQKHNVSVDSVVLIGGGALLKGLLSVAKKHIDAVVALGDPFEKIEAPAFLSPMLKEAGPEFAVAVGLALRKIQESEA